MDSITIARINNALHILGKMKAKQIAELDDVTITKLGRDAFHVTDKNGKTYRSLGKDHAAMIATRGE